MKDKFSKSKMIRKRVAQDAVYRPEDRSGHNGSGLPDGLDPPPLYGEPAEEATPVYEELVEEVNIAQEDFNASARILGMLFSSYAAESLR
jgi:hypothetical protein